MRLVWINAARVVGCLSVGGCRSVAVVVVVVVCSSLDEVDGC
jgi:hypothetical protein